MTGVPRRLVVTVAVLVCSIAAVRPPEPASAGAPLDSQYVLQRYAIAVQAVPTPKNVVFTYSVSQAGPSNIEQRHQIFRSGTNVRDELLAVDGLALSRKRVTFAKRENRYAIDRLAPRTDAAPHLPERGRHLPGAAVAGCHECRRG